MKRRKCRTGSFVIFEAATINQSAKSCDAVLGVGSDTYMGPFGGLHKDFELIFSEPIMNALTNTTTSWGFERKRRIILHLAFDCQVVQWKVVVRWA